VEYCVQLEGEEEVSRIVDGAWGKVSGAVARALVEAMCGPAATAVFGIGDGTRDGARAKAVGGEGDGASWSSRWSRVREGDGVRAKAVGGAGNRSGGGARAGAVGGVE
jgi:hypothetical protein